ncbi:hypothetical protein CIK75_02200 [Glutamicibacter sp. BW78]|nr:hypothetical protein CIK75_02200 [Glutamicibacter sp. BW78]
MHSAQTVDELPAWARWISKFGDAVFPVLVFPMQEQDGSETGQVKPQAGTVIDAEGEPMKYISPSDGGGGPDSPQLPVVRGVEKPIGVLVVEGVKQALAADAWAPAGWAIFRICGITGWSRGGSPSLHLKVVRDQEVLIVPDADAATKRQVYDGALALGAACGSRRASSVKYVWVVGFGSSGVDDQLGGMPCSIDRLEMFEDWIATAKSKPSDSPPRAETQEDRKRKAAERSARALARTRRDDERPVIHIGEDRKMVVDKVDSVLRERYEGKELFRRGEALVRLVVDRDGPVVVPVTSGMFNDLLSSAAITVDGDQSKEQSGCSHPHVWPDSNTMQAAASRYRGYQRLDGVSAVPVVRPDGSIVTETGYDPETGLYVALADDIAGISVPDSPTDADIAEARDLLTKDLLVDFLLQDQSDMAHAVAALLSPLVRPLVPTNPLLVINGLQPGVGKGKLASTMSTVVAGRAPNLAMLPDNEDEMRKALTAYLYAGSTSVFFDETHRLDSAVLNGCVTAESWSDRKLGVTERIEMPNRACFFFAGNHVEISGDTARRVVQIRLHTDVPNPQNRDGFKHDLPQWAGEHRPALLRACLILVRAWFDRGQPEAPRAFRFGSFERWQDVLGGILAVADIPGFLEGMDEQRDVADFEGQCWTAHLSWLADTCPVGRPFTAKGVSEKLLTDADAETPPGLERLLKETDPRALGKAWATQVGRWRDGHRLINNGVGQARRTNWLIEEYSPTSSSPATPTVANTVPVPTGRRTVPDEPGRAMVEIDDLDDASGSAGFTPVIEDLGGAS